MEIILQLKLGDFMAGRYRQNNTNFFDKTFGFRIITEVKSCSKKAQFFAFLTSKTVVSALTPQRRFAYSLSGHNIELRWKPKSTPKNRFLPQKLDLLKAMTSFPILALPGTTPRGHSGTLGPIKLMAFSARLRHFTARTGSSICII